MPTRDKVIGNFRYVIKTIFVCENRYGIVNSVTRFGEISPLWQYFKRRSHFCKGLSSVWQNFEPTSAMILCYWVNFHCCKWPNIEKILDHLVTLVVSFFKPPLPPLWLLLGSPPMLMNPPQPTAVTAKKVLNIAPRISHIRRHNGDKPFVCNVCKKSFTEVWAMKKHERLHTG